MLHIPVDWDLLYLGFIKPKSTQESKINKKLSPLFVKLEYAWQTHAYVIRQESLVKIMSILPIDMPIDNFLATMIYRKEIVAYGVQSQLVRQHMINKHNSSDINHTGR